MLWIDTATTTVNVLGDENDLKIGWNDLYMFKRWIKVKNTVLFIDRIIFIIRICKFSSEDDIKGHMYTIYYFCHAIRI